MITENINLGNLIIATLIAIVSFFIRKTIDKLEDRLDRHESLLTDLSIAINRLAAIEEERYRKRKSYNE